MGGFMVLSNSNRETYERTGRVGTPKIKKTD